MPWHCMPAVLLPCWTLGAEPVDLLVAVQPGVVGKISLRCIALMVPLCQTSFAMTVLTVCKGWMLLLLLAICNLSTFWAATEFADPRIRCCNPTVATGITEPTNRLVALCHHTVRGTVVDFIVPLSCNQRSLGSQGVVLADFAVAALRTFVASSPVCHTCFPAVQVASGALITCPPDLHVAVCLDVDVA